MNRRLAATGYERRFCGGFGVSPNLNTRAALAAWELG